jgi:hypothetical protein
MYKNLIVIAALAASSPVLAKSSHLTDVQYFQVARCQALFSSPALGKSDTHIIDALVKKEGVARQPWVGDHADEVRSDAARLARNGNQEQKSELIAERDGACMAYNSEPGQTMTSVAKPTTTN